MLLKPVPSEKRLNRYWWNWLRFGKDPNRSWTGKCFVCDKPGVLAVDVKYRGESRPRNLVCNQCFKKGKSWLTLP